MGEIAPVGDKTPGTSASNTSAQPPVDDVPKDPTVDDPDKSRREDEDDPAAEQLDRMYVAHQTLYPPGTPPTTSAGGSDGTGGVGSVPGAKSWAADKAGDGSDWSTDGGIGPDANNAVDQTDWTYAQPVAPANAAPVPPPDKPAETKGTPPDDVQSPGEK